MYARVGSGFVRAHKDRRQPLLYSSRYSHCINFKEIYPHLCPWLSSTADLGLGKSCVMFVEAGDVKASSNVTKLPTAF
jgi:hypothetical protein